MTLLSVPVCMLVVIVVVINVVDNMNFMKCFKKGKLSNPLITGNYIIHFLSAWPLASHINQIMHKGDIN